MCEPSKVVRKPTKLRRCWARNDALLATYRQRSVSELWPFMAFATANAGTMKIPIRATGKREDARPDCRAAASLSALPVRFIPPNNSIVLSFSKYRKPNNGKVSGRNATRLLWTGVVPHHSDAALAWARSARCATLYVKPPIRKTCLKLATVPAMNHGTCRRKSETSVSDPFPNESRYGLRLTAL